MQSMKLHRLLLAMCSLGLASAAIADTYAYDSLNRLTTVVFASGGTRTYSYDAAGNLLTVLTTGGAELTDTECFFDWAEMQVPDLLKPAKQPTQTAGTLQYRSYPATSVYLGVYDASVLALGGVLGPTPLNLGLLSNYLPLARAASCN